MRIAITGASGFLGRHVLPALAMHYRGAEIIALSSQNYNLLERAQVRQMFIDTQPDVLVHLAAYSGGIGINRTKPADFYFINIIMQALVFEEAARYGKLKKLVYPMGGCSYPATAASPIDEGQMWQGYPQDESAGYSAAKKMGIVASRSYRTQHGLKTSVIIPGNMYGEYDNFRHGESHVVPAFIRRYYEEKQAGAKAIVMWGTGAPQRDFVYAGDVAALIPYFIEEYDSVEPVNISSGTAIRIIELADTLKSTMGFEGKIQWDTSKPDGQMVKIFDITRLKSLGLSCPTSLAEGLAKTISWFNTHYANKTDGIRL
ncbi:MAG: NAD-dependent epimerase/dehydratase family protein [Cystobacterineae bacterium]|nr:NAD-dependent epimerase/dehydratase family protein [Cystobacterineae bacterium]